MSALPFRIRADRAGSALPADEDGWASLGPVGSHITNQGPFDHRTYGFK